VKYRTTTVVTERVRHYRATRVSWVSIFNCDVSCWKATADIKCLWWVEWRANEFIKADRPTTIDKSSSQAPACRQGTKASTGLQFSPPIDSGLLVASPNCFSSPHQNTGIGIRGGAW